MGGVFPTLLFLMAKESNKKVQISPRANSLHGLWSRCHNSIYILEQEDGKSVDLHQQTLKGNVPGAQLRSHSALKIVTKDTPVPVISK